MSEGVTRLILGSREWVALPELGLPAIKAKIDTGARTSALHASDIEVTGSSGAPRVRFCVQPAVERPSLTVLCEAPLKDERMVTSSNGEIETRYIVETLLRIGTQEWPIEVGLTNRAAMRYRMLIGRQAIPAGVLVDAANLFRQPRLSYKLYGPKLLD